MKNQEMNYLEGFKNHHATEAVSNTLPIGQNSPQKVNHGLYAEQLSGTSFTTPRSENLRTWLYRIRPSVVHPRFEVTSIDSILTAPCETLATGPNQYRWNPLDLNHSGDDFIRGTHTLLVTGNWQRQEGLAVHLYSCDSSMNQSVYANHDGELIILPEQGTLKIKTEMGQLIVAPLEIAVIPKGIKFQIHVEGSSRGYVGENYGHSLQLPELGPLGSNGLANPRDFLAPVAWYEDKAQSHELLVKSQGRHWLTELDHSPFDVVGWHGNLYPYKYDLRRFNTIGSISFDHPDPSIFTVLTSPTDSKGVTNLDFVIFPPRWLVQENTFRPPWYHRNIMSEYMGLLKGVYDAKTEKGGFIPGGGSLHNSYAAHGPDANAFEAASEMDLKPQKLDQTMAFMFETRYPFELTSFATQKGLLQDNYQDCWKDLKSKFNPVQ